MVFLRVFCLAVLVFVFGTTVAQEPLNPGFFQVGEYADESRTLTCISGSQGDVFSRFFWAWVPADLGLAYITLRFNFPDNIDLSNRPVFHENIGEVIITEFTGGTIEWNMLVANCPSGWIKIFTQEVELLNAEPSTIEILGENSMMRDCTFILNDVAILNELVLNDQNCSTVPVAKTAWCRVKSFYR